MNSYWLVLAILFIVSLGLNTLLGGGNTGVTISVVFFAVAIILKMILPSTSVYPLVL
jgi:hypothetical protein